MRATVGLERSNAAMSFPEIARELGITYQAVWHIYNRAMSKLRRHPELIGRMYGLAELLEQSRPLPVVYPGGCEL